MQNRYFSYFSYDLDEVRLLFEPRLQEVVSIYSSAHIVLDEAQVYKIKKDFRKAIDIVYRELSASEMFDALDDACSKLAKLAMETASDCNTALDIIDLNSAVAKMISRKKLLICKKNADDSFERIYKTNWHYVKEVLLYS